MNAVTFTVCASYGSYWVVVVSLLSSWSSAFCPDLSTELSVFFKILGSWSFYSVLMVSTLLLIFGQSGLILHSCWHSCQFKFLSSQHHDFHCIFYLFSYVFAVIIANITSSHYISSFFSYHLWFSYWQVNWFAQKYLNIPLLKMIGLLCTGADFFLLCD